jgi:hypothetical protein
MEYELLQNISSAIDNVFNHTSQDGSRKTIAKLCNDDCMEITFITILNSAREQDLHVQTVSLKKEANEIISSRLKSIKKDFKDLSGRKLNAKKVSSKDNFETLTVSPYSPLRKLKFTCTYTYEVK